MHSAKNLKHGFTLIELLVVISIVAVLATVLISLRITDKMLEYS